MPVSESGMLQVWTGEKMNYVGQVKFELPVSHPRADGERVVTGPGPPLQPHCSDFPLPIQDCQVNHLGQALEFSLGMERG